jgi:hypothetical protein
MSEVAVKKQLAPETTEPARWTGFEAPLFRGSLFGVNPFALMRQFTQEMDRAFGALPTGNGANGAWSPAIEVKQQEGKLAVTAELPGLKKEDVKVNVTDGALTIEGERKKRSARVTIIPSGATASSCGPSRCRKAPRLTLPPRSSKTAYSK